MEHAEPPQYDSPEVSSEGRLTIRVYQPRAEEVTLQAEWEGFARTPMIRDERGLWTFQTRPLAPDIYRYFLLADGLPILDLKNEQVTGGTQHLVAVSGPEPRFWEPQPGPRGTIHVHQYDSEATGTTRRVHIYTPPGYERAPRRRYPVLLLLHGSGDDDSGWVSFFGRANVILDNLINGKQAVPMIVVMPNGHIHLPDRRVDWRETDAFLERDLLGDLLPLVERSYRVKAGRASRAIAGLSMGGGQTVVVGMRNPDVFSAWGVFSAGIWTQMPEPFAASIAAFGRSGAEHLLWIGVGKNDFVYDRTQALLEKLREREIPFVYHEDDSGHQWSAWRDFLHRFAPLLFPAGTGTPALQSEVSARKNPDGSLPGV